MNVLDSRDLQERIDELEDMEAKDEEDTEELNNLEELKEEVSSSEWGYGIMFIAEDDFEEYAEELCRDVGDLPRELPPYIECHIDWEGVASDLLVDYTSVDYDGVSYYYR